MLRTVDVPQTSSTEFYGGSAAELLVFYSVSTVISGSVHLDVEGSGVLGSLGGLLPGDLARVACMKTD